MHFGSKSSAGPQSLLLTAVTVDLWQTASSACVTAASPSVSLSLRIQVSHERSPTDREVDCKHCDLFWWRTTQCELIDMERELRAGASSSANTFLWCWQTELPTPPYSIWTCVSRCVETEQEKKREKGSQRRHEFLCYTRTPHLTCHRINPA